MFSYGKLDLSGSFNPLSTSSTGSSQLCLVFGCGFFHLFPFSVGAMDVSFSRTDLIDLNQKPIFRPKLSSFQSASAYKTAKVHFVVNSSDKMGFDYKEQEF